MNILITGVSGTGKTTVGKKLQDKGFYVIDIDETEGLCHWQEKVTNKIIDYDVELNKNFIEKHNWVCDRDKLKDLIRSGAGPVIVVGMPDNIKDLISFFDKVIILQCSSEVFISRLIQRTDNDFGKDSSAQEYILGMYRDFEKEILDKGAVPINTEQPLDVVVEEVIKII